MGTLAFDGRTGAAGDMILAALIAAGADPAVLDRVEASLPVRYEIGETTRNGIRATTVDVLREGGSRNGDRGRRDDTRPEPHDHGHAEHAEDDRAGATGEEERAGEEGNRAEGHGPHRPYVEVVGIVESMDLPPAVERDALATFELLGEAEAAVHGVDLVETRFHEVGADDAIADVVGAALLIDDLDPDRIVTTRLSTGGGTVSMSHGTYPVPAPAVVELAERADWSIAGGPVERELLTPTGAAILARHAEGVDALPAVRVEGSGYGAGTAEFAEHPNVLRAIVGEERGSLRREEITVLETHLDDATPEVLGRLQDALGEAGALDVAVVPTTMKKSRPGHLVKVVVRPADAERVARRLAVETGTLGVREAGSGHRFVAGRRFETATVLIDGERHEVRVKVAATTDGETFDVSAEYDDAAAVAGATGIPVREVARRAEAAVREGRDDRLVHVLEADRWAEVGDGESYAPGSLETDGFVHCSTAERVPGVAQYNHPDAGELLALVIDPDEVDADIKYEERPSGAFAHVYGPVNRGAIVDVVAVPREDGRFVLPEELR